ncbi:hypothetical protein IFM89_015669 [Coptis chinensis]|uniref:Peptidase M14 domain-containing protein n=1 Tax=Coptis chinensis TaxID=261450 RepID=A0A835I4B5_9MAGN|nr:hypothetical protein IFM89_015669 [Coptis chinensis]
MEFFSPSSSICFFLFILFCLSSFSNPTVARGGEKGHSSNHTDYKEHNWISSRNLFAEEQTSSIFDVASGYMSNSELEKAMKQFVRRCSSISRMYSIGKSVNGIPLWVMEISDKPGEEEAEPAFKFVGNVHGDEPVGRELLLLLANWLCDNYNKDPLATLIIKNTHLHILPTMNPDGFSLRKRGNANDIDLNRDFPDQGALVANYPWDGSQDKRKIYTACPDDKTFRYMASLYSRSHFNMSLGDEFLEGITNGAAWYPIYGGMQDWNYIHGGCFELTLEISDVKWPNAKELPTLWEHNRLSMLNLVASVVKTGIHGRILSSMNGQPLPASIEIRGINYTVKAGDAFGYYHRMVSPGESYEVMAMLPGYKSKATHILLEDESMSVDFILDLKEGQQEHKQKLIQGGCNCDCDNMSKLDLLEFAGQANVQISLLLFLALVILASLCILLRRKMLLKLLKRPKRPVVV